MLLPSKRRCESMVQHEATLQKRALVCFERREVIGRKCVCVLVKSPVARRNRAAIRVTCSRLPPRIVQVEMGLERFMHATQVYWPADESRCGYVLGSRALGCLFVVAVVPSKTVRVQNRLYKRAYSSIEAARRGTHIPVKPCIAINQCQGTWGAAERTRRDNPR